MDKVAIQEEKLMGEFLDTIAKVNRHVATKYANQEFLLEMRRLYENNIAWLTKYIK